MASIHGIQRSLRSHIVIPARLASTRLPEKLLLRRTGKPMIQHTYEAALQSKKALGVCVATDHELIASEVRSFGGNVVMTDSRLACGTDRVAQAARQLNTEIIVNIQGDEPEISGEAIDQVIGLLEEDPVSSMSTLATPIRDSATLRDPSCVKVTFDAHGRALYFSRSPIPYVRNWNDSLLDDDPPHFFLHLGIYAFRREFLFQFASMTPGRIEELECLEQLRVLEHGHSIQVGIVPQASRGIDTPEEYEAFVQRRLAG